MPSAEIQTHDGGAEAPDQCGRDDLAEGREVRSAAVLAAVRNAADSDVDVAMAGLKELGWMTLEEPGRTTVARAGGVNVALCTLQRWLGQRASAVQGCLHLLRNLLTDQPAVDAFFAYESDFLSKHAEDTGYNGGGTLILEAALSGYPLRSDLQLDGCAAARALCRSDPKRCVDNGVVGYVLAALHRHPECPRLCEEGCACLGDLAADDGLCRWLVEEGVTVDYLSDALDRHVLNSTVVSSAAEALVRLQAPSDALKERVRRAANVVPAAIAALETHYLNAALAATLVELLIPHVEYYPSRFDEAAAAVRKVMSRHAEPELLADCCSLIAQLGENAPDDMTKARIARGVVPFMAAALQSFAEDEDVAEAANRGLASLVVNKFHTKLGKPRPRRQPAKRAAPRAAHADPAAAAAPAAVPAAVAAAPEQGALR
eukprot:TRINITY_DN3015_c0_g4_i1.p1 TRINITY_DN3015_c0_g4~~TRINITY_DN3015_c0_g4_i1.p1  ORF type:complete len:458 (+),score=158.83 TRINITY_DN3015_c0_g4_i1:84-1376(+)